METIKETEERLSKELQDGMPVVVKDWSRRMETEKLIDHCNRIRSAKFEANKAVRDLWCAVSLGQDHNEESLKKANKIEELWKQMARLVDKRNRIVSK